MQVPMPFVPSTSSDHTPPSQVPQYWNWLARASSPRCATATPELSQSKTVYPASRTTLYNSSISPWALKMSLSSGSRRCFSSEGVRMRGALLSSGSRPCFFADLRQELDTACIPSGGVAPSATEQTCSACPAIVSSELADRSESPITAPGLLRTRSWRRRAVQFPTVAKRAVAANGAAAPRGTADTPKKALSKRYQGTPRGVPPQSPLAGGQLTELFSPTSKGAQIADPDAGHLARF